VVPAWVIEVHAAAAVRPTTENMPESSGWESPNISAKKLAEALRSRAAIIMWLKRTVIASDSSSVADSEAHLSGANAAQRRS
jgi:hypothetical protein